MRRRTVIIAIVLGVAVLATLLGNGSDSAAVPTEVPPILVTELPTASAVPVPTHTSRPSVSCDPADSGVIVFWLASAENIVGVSLNSVRKLETDDTPIELQEWRDNVGPQLEQIELSLGEPPDCLWEAEMSVRSMALTTQKLFGEDPDAARAEIVTSAVEFFGILETKGLETNMSLDLLAYFGLP